MLSGIGPAKALKALGIKPVLDLPDVGQHLADHPFLTNQFGVADSSDDLIDNVSRNATFAGALVGEWLATKQGAMTVGGQSQLGWLRIPANDSAFKSTSDPSAGPLSPHYEFLFAVRVRDRTLLITHSPPQCSLARLCVIGRHPCPNHRLLQHLLHSSSDPNLPSVPHKPLQSH